MHRNHLLPIGYLVRIPADIDEPELSQRSVVQTCQRQIQSPTQTVNDGDALLSSGSDYEEVHPPRPLGIGWGDLWPQPEVRQKKDKSLMQPKLFHKPKSKWT